MDLREQALDEIALRISNAKDTLGLKGFRRTPTRPVDEKYIPCIFMIEGEDEIVKPSNRDSNVYPAVRELEVGIDIVAYKSETDIKQLYRQVRAVVLRSGIIRGNILADNKVPIWEIRTEGPTGYGLPDLIGMTLVLKMSYTDDGT
jgi:hypothetical protein